MIEELYGWLGDTELYRWLRDTSAGVTAGVVVSLTTLWLSERRRNQRIKRNLLKAVDIETEHNIKLAIKNETTLSNYVSLLLSKLTPSVILTPFRTSLIGKHLEQLEMLENFNAIEKLLEVYSLIEEANSLIAVMPFHSKELGILHYPQNSEMQLHHIITELRALSTKIRKLLDEARESLNLEKLNNSGERM